MKRITIFLTTVLLTMTLVACNNNKQEYDNVVYVTVYPMQYLVEEIAGDTVHVEYVPGASSHGASFDPSGKQIIDMMEADLMFYINGGADTYIPNSADLFDGGNVELVDMSEHITYNKICLTHSDDHEHDTTTQSDTEEPNTECDENSLTPDPHFWLDPVKMITAAEYVKTKLISTYPENTELYKNNFTVLNAGLEKLHQDFQQMQYTANKPIITTIKLFTYWEVRYKIEIFSVTNDVHSSEGTAGDYTELLEEALFHDIHFVCFESNANSPEGDAFVDLLNSEYTKLQKNGVTVFYLHGLGKITTEEVENGSNYISIMYDNLEVLNTITK